MVRWDPNEKLLFVFDLFITINNPIHITINNPIHITINNPIHITINNPINITINNPINITINNPIHAKTNISFSIPDIREMNLVSLLLTLGLTGARWLIGLFLYLFDLNAASF